MILPRWCDVSLRTFASFGQWDKQASWMTAGKPLDALLFVAEAAWFHYLREIGQLLGGFHYGPVTNNICGRAVATSNQFLAIRIPRPPGGYSRVGASIWNAWSGDSATGWSHRSTSLNVGGRGFPGRLCSARHAMGDRSGWGNAHGTNGE